MIWGILFSDLEKEKIRCILHINYQNKLQMDQKSKSKKIKNKKFWKKIHYYLNFILWV